MFPMLLLASLLCLCIKYFLNDYALPYYFLIFLTGLFLGGPYALISATITIDLA